MVASERFTHSCRSGAVAGGGDARKFGDVAQAHLGQGRGPAVLASVAVLAAIPGGATRFLPLRSARWRSWLSVDESEAAADGGVSVLGGFT